MLAASAHLHRPGVIGVLYAEDFDDLGDNVVVLSHPEPEPEIIEPVFTAAELDAARADALLAGRAAAERDLTTARNQLLQSLVTGIAETRAAARDIAEQAASGVATCMLSLMAACLPALCAQHGAAELQALVRVLLPALTEEPRVTVRINPQMLPVMQAEIDGLDAEIAERVHLLATDSMPPGDARITWAEGSAVRDTSRARAAFEDGLAELGLLQREQANA